jgi:deoxyribodipyrimidine photo-lyase
MEIGIIYFRRDLRIYDNIALNECIKNSDKILPIFIFNPVQINKSNSYFNDKCFSLMQLFIEQLSEYLNNKLLLLQGNPANVIGDLIKNIKTEYSNANISLYFNIDFTPFSIKRDSEIFDKVKNVRINAFIDHMLTLETTVIDSKSGLSPGIKFDYYKKFTPFYEYYKSHRVSEPHTVTIKKFLELKHSDEYKLHINYKFKFSRTNAIHQINKKIKYADTHNYPDNEEGTYHISHYLKFGVISIREAYHGLKNDNIAIRQLYWREFYNIICWNNPQLLQSQISNKNNSALNAKYNAINWSDDSNKKSAEIIKAWKTGMTGFPIVDAGMRQLSKTGYMHNRVRLITASFLTKICGIDWRIGEQWFAQNLIDYDPIINNGNWLWVAGGGADSQPYFRVFNPWLQQLHYDHDCIYIKCWINELKDVEPKIIHKLFNEKYRISNYIHPIINYDEEKNKTHIKYTKIYS